MNTAIDEEKVNSETRDSIMSKLKDGLSTVGSRVLTALITTATLSLGFMVFNDYIAPPPDVSGRWKFTVVYEETSLAAFENLNVTYQTLMTQEGLKLSATGEKLSDRGPQIDPVDYTNDRRVNIDMVGNISRSYFGPDKVVVHYREAGRRRPSSTLQTLETIDARTMCGCFQSTIADTIGSVWWQKVEDRRNLYDPVTRPAQCASTTCREMTN